ncbi:MAG: hypothetical protein P3C12_07205 [Gemmatimonadota bacterium]|nr:hypothetical protein [Gemmatimonadota bacterium]
MVIVTTPGATPVIVVVPTDTLVIPPLASTDTTLGTDELQTAARPRSVVPLAARTTAAAVVVQPTMIDLALSATDAFATGNGMTVIDAAPHFPR